MDYSLNRWSSVFLFLESRLTLRARPSGISTFKDQVRNGRDAFPMVPLFADVAFCTPQRWRFPGRFIPRHSAVTDHRDVLDKYLLLRALFLHLREGKGLKEGALKALNLDAFSLNFLHCQKSDQMNLLRGVRRPKRREQIPHSHGSYSVLVTWGQHS